jgi:hypothetical protein
MSNLCKDDILLNFIENKILDKIIDKNKIYFIFMKLIIRILLQTYNILDNINYSICCCDIIILIFWIILSYTNNLKLSMFLCERAIILFIEYIKLSNNMQDNSINIIDVKVFIYKKTIGPINMYQKTSNKIKYYISIKKLTELSTNLIYNIFIKLSNKNLIEELSDGLVNILYELNELKCIDFLNKNILKILDSTNNILYDINFLKIKLELYYYILSNKYSNHYSIYKNNIKDYVLDPLYNDIILDKKNIYELKIFKEILI